MMGFVIVARNPHTKKVVALMDEERNLVEFPSKLAAAEAPKPTPLKAWGYQIMKVEDWL